MSIPAIIEQISIAVPHLAEAELEAIRNAISPVLETQQAAINDERQQQVMIPLSATALAAVEQQITTLLEMTSHIHEAVVLQPTDAK
jgi:hypothetical protein